MTVSEYMIIVEDMTTDATFAAIFTFGTLVVMSSVIGLIDNYRRSK